LLRIVNAAGSKSLELVITEEYSKTPAEACQVWEIAIDGIYLNEPRTLRLGKTFLIPACKVDWIVVCNRPGRYKVSIRYFIVIFSTKSFSKNLYKFNL